MRILITGGAGYPGTERVHALARTPDIEQLVVYDNLSRGEAIQKTRQAPANR